MKQKVVDLPSGIAQRLEEILGKQGIGILRNKMTILMLTKNKLKNAISQPIKQTEPHEQPKNHEQPTNHEQFKNPEQPNIKNYEQLKQQFLKAQETKLQQGVQD